ncbi:type 1 glutamine amidotransferase [Spongiactinospora sp. 9N601]|uniref:type 1 glutamine amidotransferase n=1 Tax=Spongiactinospora sp. 9N601 TaxID=3375149 RepID=UPI003789CF25
MAITIVEHQAEAPAGPLAGWLTEAGADHTVVRPYLGEPVPARAGGGLMVLGGSASAWEDEVCPWLPATRDLIARCVADGVPTLGICLGAQLMTIACGGTVERGAAGLEVGLTALIPLPQAAGDPLFGGLGPAVAVQYHQDATTVPPPGAVPLLTGERYPHQAYRLGEAAWAAQFHLEADHEIFARWTSATADALADAGHSPGELDAEVRREQDRLTRTWRPVGHAFAGLCRSRSGVREVQESRR